MAIVKKTKTHERSSGVPKHSFVTENKTVKSNKTKITKDMSIMEILQKKPDAYEIMTKHGLHCIGCGGAAFESLENGSLMHGLEKKEIDKMVDEINRIKQPSVKNTR